jgi:hypothetical protein
LEHLVDFSPYFGRFVRRRDFVGQLVLARSSDQNTGESLKEDLGLKGPNKAVNRAEPVARGSDYETEGHWFESCRARSEINRQRAAAVSLPAGFLLRLVLGAIEAWKRPPFDPERIEDLIDFRANFRRLVCGWDRPGEFGLTKRIECFSALEEVDAAGVARRLIPSVDLLPESGQLEKSRSTVEQATRTRAAVPSDGSRG